jgi:hypothetical protein
MAICSFKCLRFPDGMLNKHKAWLCVHGGQQTWGLDYWDTYAPVVTWASVRRLLIIANKIMVSYPKALILFLHSLKLTLMYQSIRSFQLACIPLMFQMVMVTNINTFSNSTKVFTASNKLDIIGLKNYVKDSLLTTSFKVRSINVSSFERIVLCSLMLMIAIYLART